MLGIQRNLARNSVLRLSLWAAFASSLWVARPPSALVGQTADDRLAAHLAAGEFGPALTIAKNSPTAAERDARLAKVANSQLRAGARYASLNSVAQMNSDHARNSAFESAGRGYFGNGAQGGAALADFDTLIQLIQQTIAPDTWVDAGGVGAVEPFPTGVLVDAAGVMRRGMANPANETLAGLRRASLEMSGNRNVRQRSALRKISLTRLERQAHKLWAMGKRPDEAMRMLAGLTRIKYILVYPESRDIVLAGPADDWVPDAEGRFVGVESRQPVLRLDDLVVVLRNSVGNDPAVGATTAGKFGCAIKPRQENLAAVQEFIQESSRRSLKPGERAEWLAGLRERLGPQDIEVFGIDPRTRVARILVEADYHMKLVGMGLEQAPMGVPSYLSSIQIPPGGSPPPMDVLRWWFTMNYDAAKTTQQRDAFEIVGPGVQVLCENELLAQHGQRQHTGEATNLNRQFATNFTKHFADLAIRYPVYAELRNVFDLALVAAVIHEEDLAGRCQWHQTFFGPQGKYQVELEAAPKQVDSIINHRIIDRKHLVVGVSGGVSADPNAVLKTAVTKTDTYGLLNADRAAGVPPNLPTAAWWWD